MSEVLFLLLFAWRIACMIPPHCVWIWFLVKNRGWAELYICCAPLHRGRTCEGYFPNFILPISYLGFIWDLYVFVKKQQPFIFPFSHGQGTHSAKIVLIARLKIPQVPQNILVQFVCPNLKVWDFWNKKVSLGVRSPCTTWLKMGWISFWNAFSFFSCTYYSQNKWIPLLWWAEFWIRDLKKINASTKKISSHCVILDWLLEE